MAVQQLPPGPGKTAPRLIEDLLDYDLTSKASKNGKNLLVDPAPQLAPKSLAPARKGVKDCRHSLMLKNLGKDGSLDIPRSIDERAEYGTKYSVQSYCINCRFHFEIKTSFDRFNTAVNICHRSDHDNPLHHFRLVSSLQGSEWEKLVGSKAVKYDPLAEYHRFICTGQRCPAAVEIRITRPRLSLKLLACVTDPAKVHQRGLAQIRGSPERYDGQSPVAVKTALEYFRTYLINALKAASNHEEVRRIAKRNKKYMMAFANECDELYEYLDFKTVEGDVDPDHGPTYFWQPEINDQNRSFVNDAITELELHIRRHDTEGTFFAPTPALHSIEKCLGYYDYPTRKRAIDLDTVEHPYYASLGACENFNDEYLSWAYDRQRDCDPANRPYYLDCLQDLANGRKSSDLQTKVAMAESAGELGLQAIREAYEFFTSDPDTAEGDGHIIGLYRSRIESSPRQKDEARRCLAVIAKHRDSAQIDAVANDRSMSFEEALEYLSVTADTGSDSIEASAIAMSIDGDKSRVAAALRVIANRRVGDNSLQRAAASMESGNGGYSLSITDAYNRLQIQQHNVPDETVLTYYSQLSKGAPSGSQDSYKEALRIIALDRDSNYLLRKLENPDADVQATTADPVGLDNIGNTCYLNSLLQYYYTIRPIRDMVINFQDHRMIINEENLRRKRAGGRIISKAEIVKAQKFVDELHDLFENLKTASTRSVKPTKELAELTIFSTEKEETFRRKSISSPRGPPTISSVLEGGGVVYGPQLPPPAPSLILPEEDIEMTDRPLDRNADVEDSGSEATLVDTEQAPPLVKFDSKRVDSTTSVSSVSSKDKKSVEFKETETKEDVEGDALMVNGSNTPENYENIVPPQEKPPPIPPRNKSGLVISTSESISTNSNKAIIADNDFWRFGVQQDVAEVIGNVIFRLQCAIKPTSIDSSSEEQIDVISDTFYGSNTTYTQKAHILEKKKEIWSYLLAFPGKNVIRDIYEAIDVAYDEQTVEVENTTRPQYVSISKLPPILQFQIQRTDWTAELGSHKNRTHVAFPETIYMDRYVDTEDPDSVVMRRRRDTWKWKAQLRVLEARRAALENSTGEIPVSEALNTVKQYIQSLQEEEVEGIDIDPALPEVLEERISEVMQELESLWGQIDALKAKLRDQFTDMRKYEYNLHSVFIHRGEAGGGHYWVYIYDFKNDKWREYNDENVSEVKDRRRIFDDQGAAGNPYLLVYVRSEDKNNLVEAVCRDVQDVQDVQDVPAAVSMIDNSIWSGENEMDGMEVNGDWGYIGSEGSETVSAQHVEHAPRPLRPKPGVTGVVDESSWAKNWPPASDGNGDW